MSGPRLSIIPARAATDRSLKPRDLQVLCVLGRHTDDLGWCRRSQVKMADEMGCARSTVFEAIERLVKNGYLERHEKIEESGRDSAHFYRVILDPIHPNVAAVKEVEDPCRLVGTPADIPAPPAGPEPAPPAGPGPAPINDPSLTTPINVERERGREDEERKLVERWLKKHHPAWPSYVSDSAPKALAAAQSLTADEREKAVERMSDYLASAKVGGRTVVCTFAVYLSEKRWEKLPEKAPVKPVHDDYAPPFGPVWSGWLVGALLDGGGNGEAVAYLFRQARLGRGHRFGERWHGLKPLMEPVPVNSDRWREWEGEFERRGWPWLPDPGVQRVVFFPAGGPERLMEFEQAVRGEHDDGTRQAAE